MRYLLAVLMLVGGVIAVPLAAAGPFEDHTPNECPTDSIPDGVHHNLPNILGPLGLDEKIDDAQENVDRLSESIWGSPADVDPGATSVPIDPSMPDGPSDDPILPVDAGSCMEALTLDIDQCIDDIQCYATGCGN
ncbi:MAG TPA: hypothetical protein VI997_03430 [Candidatus Thermoplasmatota archaeon]|nr:hypothetical protein [Candidatus Thermoplasmatota archaeon]